ncbi:MAG TPA: NAD(+) diphosphatase [Dissulfurispiraceae bacterium]|nr:NAD(+) diphosphatase [Dissulfurispiraceae bacterium]
MSFVISVTPLTGNTDEALWFIFRGDKLLVRTPETGAGVPHSQDITGIHQNIIRSRYLGTLNKLDCYAAEIYDNAAAPHGMSFQELRPLLGLLDEDFFSAAGRAFQIIHWERTHQFCGRCGGRTRLKADERALECTHCGLEIYPEISPAIIVAVIRGVEILLARSHRFRNQFYSVLAGFVEYGETFEETVRREVREEVGIELKNIRYFGSQPWPFPNSLMVGFMADYASGEIRPDQSEIVDAGWFASSNLPVLPRTGTIARRLIDFFKEGAGK